MKLANLVLLIFCIQSIQTISQTSITITNTNALVPNNTRVLSICIEEDVNKQRYFVVSTHIIGVHPNVPLTDLNDYAYPLVADMFRKDARLVGKSFDRGGILDNITDYLRSQASVIALQDRQYNSCSISRQVTKISFSTNAINSGNIDISFEFDLRFQFVVGNQSTIDSQTQGQIASTLEAEMRRIDGSYGLGDFNRLTVGANNLQAKYAIIANLPLPYSGAPTPVDESDSPNQLNFGIGLGIASTLKKAYSYHVSSFDTTLQRQALNNPFFTASFTLSWTPNFTYLDEVNNAYYEAPGWFGTCLSLNISDVNLTDSSFNPRINGGIGFVIRPRSRVEFGVLCDFIRWDVLNDYESNYLGKKYTIDPKNDLVPSLFTKQTIPALSFKVIFRISDFRMDNYRLRNSGDPAK